MEKEALLTLENLKVHFSTERGRVTAVDGVHLSIKPGEIVGIVGESGCGKSVMSQTILRLLEHTDPVHYEGKVIFNDENLLELPLNRMRQIRGNEISVIFQDPLTSLNPVYTIGNQMDEVQILHKRLSKEEARAKTIELLGMTGIPLPEQCAGQYPHELSGGMQQRVMIAMALACEPKLLIADEPTTALDVTIQAQILDLILDLNKRLGMAVLFITHDLGVVAEVCDSVRVMYLGQVMEESSTDELFENPLHPYTRGLIKSIPKMQDDRMTKLHVIEGTVPSLLNVPVGCRFSTRCEYADDKCHREESEVKSINGGAHKVKCWHFEKLTTAGEV